MDEREFDYINVIPFVDVMLVLLTIVLMTSTFIATGIIPIELPTASKTESKMLKTQTIEIDHAGNLYLNSKPVSVTGLRAALAPLDRITYVLIRADKDIPLQIFVDVLDIVKSLGFQKVNLQTEKKT